MKRVNSVLLILIFFLMGVSAFLIVMNGQLTYDIVFGNDLPQSAYVSPASNSSNGTTQNNVSSADNTKSDEVKTKSIPLESIKTTYKLSIPRLGLNSSIRDDTVNANYAVYHYPESVQPGNNGECGLLGHRTSYTSPFEYIRILVPGDDVYIYDEGNKKKYIYKVVSNGKDIRYDYKTNPIKFQTSGTSRLLLVTCYPPGTTRAAWITHCELDSVDSY
ncbi:MAG: sortase (surface protein transpeptidase) [Methanobacterium sp. Maddingley MBC34]|nr:MAG: sortase (surface protein transpeptidase) [Methanobacterium sp. Maddingley MBC34]